MCQEAKKAISQAKERGEVRLSDAANLSGLPKTGVEGGGEGGGLLPCMGSLRACT